MRPGGGSMRAASPVGLKEEVRRAVNARKAAESHLGAPLHSGPLQPRSAPPPRSPASPARHSTPSHSPDASPSPSPPPAPAWSPPPRRSAKASERLLRMAGLGSPVSQGAKHSASKAQLAALRPASPPSPPRPEASPELAARLFDALDSNQDGVIDRQEWREARGKLAASEEEEGPGEGQAAVLAKLSADKLAAAEEGACKIRQQAAEQAARIRREALREAERVEGAAQSRLKSLEDETEQHHSQCKQRLHSTEAALVQRERDMKAAGLAAAKSKQLLAAKKSAEQRAMQLQHAAEEEAAVTILKAKADAEALKRQAIANAETVKLRCDQAEAHKRAEAARQAVELRMAQQAAEAVQLRSTLEHELAALREEAEEDARLTKQLAEQDAAAIERLAALKVAGMQRDAVQEVEEQERAEEEDRERRQRAVALAEVEAEAERKMSALEAEHESVLREVEAMKQHARQEAEARRQQAQQEAAAIRKQAHDLANKTAEQAELREAKRREDKQRSEELSHVRERAEKEAREFKARVEAEARTIREQASQVAEALKSQAAQAACGVGEQLEQIAQESVPWVCVHPQHQPPVGTEIWPQDHHLDTSAACAVLGEGLSALCAQGQLPVALGGYWVCVLSGCVDSSQLVAPAVKTWEPSALAQLRAVAEAELAVREHQLARLRCQLGLSSGVELSMAESKLLVMLRGSEHMLQQWLVQVGLGSSLEQLRSQSSTEQQGAARAGAAAALKAGEPVSKQQLDELSVPSLRAVVDLVRIEVLTRVEGLAELTKEAERAEPGRYKHELEGAVARLQQELLAVHQGAARLVLHAESTGLVLDDEAREQATEALVLLEEGERGMQARVQQLREAERAARLGSAEQAQLRLHGREGLMGRLLESISQCMLVLAVQMEHKAEQLSQRLSSLEQVLRSELCGELQQQLVSMQMMAQPVLQACAQGQLSSSEFYSPARPRLWKHLAVGFAVARAQLVSRVVVRSGSMETTERAQMGLAAIARLLAEGTELELLGVRRHALPAECREQHALSLLARLVALVLRDSARSGSAELSSMAAALENLPSAQSGDAPPGGMVAPAPAALRAASPPGSRSVSPGPSGLGPSGLGPSGLGPSGLGPSGLDAQFDRLDLNADGVIDLQEFSRALAAPEEGSSHRQAPEEGSSHRQAPEEGSSHRQAPEEGSSYRQRVSALVAGPKSAAGHPCVLCNQPVGGHNCGACCGVFCGGCCAGS